MPLRLFHEHGLPAITRCPLCRLCAPRFFATITIYYYYATRAERLPADDYFRYAILCRARRHADDYYHSASAAR